MAIRERFGAGWRAFRDPSLVRSGGVSPSTVLAVNLDDLSLRQKCDALRLYRENRAYRDLYRMLGTVAVPEDFDRIRSLENPALAAVDFHVAHVFPGSLDEALSLNPGAPSSLLEAWTRMADWGNLAALKDALPEDASTYGDGILKAVSKEDGSQVYPELRHAGEFVEFREDNRRNAVRVRMDVELKKDDPSDPGWWTEVWDKAENSYLAYFHDLGYGADLESMPSTFAEKRITDFGHDFVPFHRVPFRAGVRPNQRSTGVFEPHLEAIDHLLRTATELGDLFRDNGEGVWATMPGRPDADAITMRHEEERGEQEEGRAHGRRVVHFPGVASMADLVPRIDYKAGLDIEAARRAGLERSLQELRYSRGRDGGDPSAAAIRQDQAPALMRARALRSNAESGLVKVLKMCLTMGVSRNLFPGVGTFRSGDYDAFFFEPREVAPESPSERYASQETRVRIWSEHARMGTLAFYLENEEGFEPSEAERVAGLAQGASKRASVSDLLNRP